MVSNLHANEAGCPRPASVSPVSPFLLSSLCFLFFIFIIDEKVEPLGLFLIAIGSLKWSRSNILAPQSYPVNVSSNL